MLAVTVEDNQDVSPVLAGSFKAGLNGFAVALEFNDIPVQEDRFRETPSSIQFYVDPPHRYIDKTMGSCKNVKYVLRLAEDKQVGSWIDRGRVVFDAPKNDEDRYFS